MLNSNNIYNTSVLDDCQQILDVVADNITFNQINFVNRWKTL